MSLHELVERCKECIAQRKDYWIHNGLASRADVLNQLAQLDKEHRYLAAKYYFVASFYASVLHTDVSVDSHILHLRLLVEDYDPTVEYGSLQEKVHGTVPYKQLSLSKDERRLLEAFDRFTLRYPDFDYQLFFEDYFLNATESPLVKPLAEIIPFPARRTA